MISHWRSIRFHSTATAAIFFFASFFLAAPAPAQVSEVFKDNNEHILIGNISMRAEKPYLGFEEGQPLLGEQIYVEGPIQLAATVFWLDPKTYRSSGNLPADLGGVMVDGGEADGTVRVGIRQYKLLGKQILDNVLQANNLEGAPNYRLLWRGKGRNLARGFRSANAPLPLPAVVVGNRDPQQPSFLSAQDFIQLSFAGEDGAGGISPLEAGRYSIKPQTGGRPLETGSRRGLIPMVGFLNYDIPLQFDCRGLLNIRRSLRTILPGDLGGARVGEVYEVGRISGRFEGRLEVD
jgi:hypothetical protein